LLRHDHRILERPSVLNYMDLRLIDRELVEFKLEPLQLEA